MKYISDQTIYLWLRELRIVGSQYHLSALCGRSPGWFSSTRCQGRQMTPAAIMMLVSHLQQVAERECDALARERVRVITTHIQQQIMHRAVRRLHTND
jgi:hypothetical protein